VVRINRITFYPSSQLQR
ncbi:hypothetical protein SNEBB_008448, partial [Seison nebaliae]